MTGLKMSKRVRCVICITLILFAIFFISVPGAGAQAKTLTRIYGSDRVATAVEISRYGWATAETILLARADDFPDALAGTPLAFKYGAPLLLTGRRQLNAQTREEIVRLQAQKVIILGGEGAVAPAVAAELEAMGLTVRRIGGADRFETARLIAAELGPNPERTAVVACGGDFPDALAVAPFAARNGYPILLAQRDRLPEPTREALSDIEQTLVVGGSGVIAEGVLSDLPGARRLAGTDRFETAAAIIRELGVPTGKAVMATGTVFADALTGSALAARENAVLLLVKPDSLPAPTRDVITENQIEDFLVLGGQSAIADSVLREYPILYGMPKLGSVTAFYALGDSQTSSWTNLFGAPFPEHGPGNTAMITDLALGWFTLDREGNILTQSHTGWQRPEGWERVLELAREYNLDTEMVIHETDTGGTISALLNNEAAMQRAISGIMAEASLYGGVNLNLEEYGFDKTGEELATCREKFTRFVRLLAEPLQAAGKTLTLTLHPPNSVFKGYDYRALGEVADRIIIMAYEYGFKPEPEYLVRQAVEAALAAVPPAGLQLGISAYSETAESMAAKIKMAQEYNLNGIALWRLGLISEEMWAVLRAFTP